VMSKAIPVSLMKSQSVSRQLRLRDLIKVLLITPHLQSSLGLWRTLE
jgi:hypothetical protein